MMSQPSEERVNTDGSGSAPMDRTNGLSEPTMGAEDVGGAGAVPPASGMAVLSLLCTMGSVGACCVSGGLAYLVDEMFGLGILVAPAAAIIGVVLGFVALVRIKRSPVALVGRPMAIGGMFIGIIALILQGAIILGPVLTFRAMQTELVPVAGFLGEHAHRRDLQRAKGVLAPEAFGALEGDRDGFERFAEAIERAVGRPRGAELRIGDLMAGHRLVDGARLRGTLGDAGAFRPDGPDAPMPRPVQLVGESGRATFIVFLDEDALKSGRRVLVLDALLVVSEESWTAATLLEDGPAATMARGLGLRLD